MQPVMSQRPQQEDKISPETISKESKSQKMRGLDVCIKHVDQQDLKICNPNPLFPEATSPLCFSIDRVTHEELISSGLQVRIIKQHAICGYMNIRRKSIASARGHLNFLPNHSDWLKKRLSTDSVDSFFHKYAHYSIELNVSNKAVLESHLRNLQKDYSRIGSANKGDTLGFVTFNENSEDKDWLDVHGLYILPEYQKLGLGTFLVRAVVGVGLSNNKQGVEFDDPFFWGTSGFYEHKGMNLMRRGPRHSDGCAQLKLINDDGSHVTSHQLLPKSSEYPLEFKKMKAPEFVL